MSPPQEAQPTAEPTVGIAAGSSQLLPMGDAGLSDRRVLGGSSSSPDASWCLVGEFWALQAAWGWGSRRRSDPEQSQPCG